LSVSPANGQLSEGQDITLKYTCNATESTDMIALRVFAKVYFCRQADVCLFEQVCFEVPFEVSSSAAQGRDNAIKLHYDVAAPPA
jgi:hypothetical protein